MTTEEDSSGKKRSRELDTEPPIMLPPDIQSISDGVKVPSPAAREDKSAESQSPNSESHSPANRLEASPSIRVSISGFRILKELGRGGMGAVYLATEESLNRNVALKIVSQSLLGSKGLMDRFDSEIRTLASLQHSNIAQLYSAGLNKDEPYFAMEYVDGPTLEGLASKPLKDSEAAALMVKLCEAVDYCHQQGVIHRDLKPSNILMTADGQPKIADFGLAKALHRDDSSTKTGEILGTPGYMSPEQAGGVVKNLGPSCDVYGLGAILYRLLTGRAPFASQEPFQTIIQVLSEDPVAPRSLNRSVSKDLETICLKCLEKKPSKRYATAAELKDDLNRFLEAKPILARPNSWIHVSGKWMLRNPTSTVAILAMVVVVIGSIVGLVMHNSVLSDELARSSRLANVGSEFAKWITDEHLATLNRLSGTTDSRTKLIKRVSDFLEESYNDMPADPLYTERLGYTYSQLAATQGAGAQNTKGELEQARKNLERAIEIYDLTLAEAPSERVSRLKVDAIIALSDLEGRLGNKKEQQQLLVDAQNELKPLDSSEPDAKFAEIQILNRKIDQQIEQREYQNAIGTIDQLVNELGLLNSLGDEKYKPELINQRILVCSYRATCQKNLNDYEGAESSYREMVRLAEESSKADPEDVMRRQRLSTAKVNLGDILFEQKKGEESLEYYEQASQVARLLADEDPASVDAQLNLGIKLSRLATNHQYLGNLDKAEVAIKEAIDRLKKLKELGKKHLTIEEGIILYLQNYASIGFLQQKPEIAGARFAEHRKQCEAYMEKYEDDSFAVNQLAESELSQALMVFGGWMNSPIEPSTVRAAEEYKTIKKHLKQGIQYYEQFRKEKPLDIDQQQQLKRIQEIDELLEQTVAEIESKADQ